MLIFSLLMDYGLLFKSFSPIRFKNGWHASFEITVILFFFWQSLSQSSMFFSLKRGWDINSEKNLLKFPYLHQKLSNTGCQHRCAPLSNSFEIFKGKFYLNCDYQTLPHFFAWMLRWWLINFLEIKPDTNLLLNWT